MKLEKAVALAAATAKATAAAVADAFAATAKPPKRLQGPDDCKGSTTAATAGSEARR